jgi:hypothetical protein
MAPEAGGGSLGRGAVRGEGLQTTALAATGRDVE